MFPPESDVVPTIDGHPSLWCEGVKESLNISLDLCPWRLRLTIHVGLEGNYSELYPSSKTGPGHGGSATNPAQNTTIFTPISYPIR